VRSQASLSTVCIEGNEGRDPTLELRFSKKSSDGPIIPDEIAIILIAETNRDCLLKSWMCGDLSICSRDSRPSVAA
jgi:hypothetical protein